MDGIPGLSTREDSGKRDGKSEGEPSILVRKGRCGVKGCLAETQAVRSVAYRRSVRDWKRSDYRIRGKNAGLKDDEGIVKKGL